VLILDGVIKKEYMSELGNTLTPLSPEEFEGMMNPGDTSVEIPFGMDVMVTLPAEQSSSNIGCSLETGDGSGDEDEYPPFDDPVTETSLNNLY